MLNGKKTNGWLVILALGGLGILAANLFKPATIPSGQASTEQMVNANNQGITATQLAQANGKASNSSDKTAINLQLPTQLERELVSTDFSVAKRNPFVAVTEAVQITKKVIIAPVVAPAPPQATIQAPPSPPLAPQLNLRFIGRITEPNGKRVVFANMNDNPLTLTEGYVLPNGFRVDAIKEDAVELTYTPLNTLARFELPKSPIFDIR
jgi:hypothetical protein